MEITSRNDLGANVAKSQPIGAALHGPATPFREVYEAARYHPLAAADP
jgi:hypothetical protein